MLTILKKVLIVSKMSLAILFLNYNFSIIGLMTH